MKKEQFKIHTELNRENVQVNLSDLSKKVLSFQTSFQGKPKIKRLNNDEFILSPALGPLNNYFLHPTFLISLKNLNLGYLDIYVTKKMGYIQIIRFLLTLIFFFTVMFPSFQEVHIINLQLISVVMISFMSLIFIVFNIYSTNRIIKQYISHITTSLDGELENQL